MRIQDVLKSLDYYGIDYTINGDLSKTKNFINQMDDFIFAMKQHVLTSEFQINKTSNILYSSFNEEYGKYYKHDCAFCA
nr:MAG TPA: hypothetical protein [Caudoviricetes sp.]